jgi:hypothetical protein
MSESYFDGVFWREAGKFFNWVKKPVVEGYKNIAQERKWDSINNKVYYEDKPITDTVQNIGRQTGEFAGQLARNIGRAPVLGPAVTPLPFTYGELGASAGKTALTAVDLLYRAFHESVERPVATGFALSGDVRRGRLEPNLQGLERAKDIYEATKGSPYGEVKPLTMGQAIDYAGGPNILWNPVFHLTPIADNPNFEITSREDRTREYFDNYAKSFTTGITDFFLQATIGGKGVGGATKTGWQAVGRTRPINPKTMGIMEREVADFIAEADPVKVMTPFKIGKDEIMRETLPPTFRPTSGMGEQLKAIFQTDPDPSKLRAVPIIGRLTTEPYTYRPATVVADLMLQPDAVTKVSAYLLAEMGSPTAFRILENAAPAIADGMKLAIPKNQFKPLSNDEITYGPTRLLNNPDELNYLTKVFEDMAQSPYVGEQLLEMARAGYSPGLLSWAPSGWKWIERGNIAASRFKDQARYAEPAPYVNVNIGGDVYRPMTIINDNTQRVATAVDRFAKSGWQNRPSYRLQFTGDRKYQDIDEISALFAQSSELRKDPNYIRGAVNKYMLAGPDETIRERVGKEIREDVIYQVIRRSSPATASDKELKEMVALAIEELERVRKTAIDNPEVGKYGVTAVAMEEGGKVIFIDSMTKASLKNSIIMPDLGAIERSTRKYWQQQSVIGNTLQSGKQLYEALHQLFSAAVLIRAGYTLKNAVVEPELRWFNFLGSIYNSDILINGLRNSAVNTVKITRDPETKRLVFKSNVAERAKVAFSEYTFLGGKKQGVSKTRINELQKEVNELGLQKSNIENLIKRDQIALKRAKKKKDTFAKSGETGLVTPIRAVEDLIKTRKQEVTALNLRMTTVQEEMSLIAGTLPASRLAKLRSERLSQFTDEIQVNGYGVDAAFSSKWSGNAWKTNISPVETIFRPVIEAQTATKRASELIDVPLTADKPSYPGAMAMFMNTNLQDKSFRMILEGRSDEAVAEYLIKNLNQFGEASELSRIATDYTLRQGKFKDLKKFLEDPDFVGQIVKTQRQTADDFFPDQNFRDFALSVNQMTDKMIKERFGAAIDSGVWPDGRRMPVLYGPDYAERQWQGIRSTVAIRNAYLRITDLFAKGFGVVSIPEYNWFKIPFYNMKFQEAMNMQAKMAAQIGRGGAEYVKDNPMWRGRAHQYALEAIDNVFYSVPRMNNIQYFLRFFATFPVPVLNSAKFYSRAILNNPYTLIVLDKVVNFPYSIGETFDGIVVDEDGNKVERKDAFNNLKGQFLIFPTKDELQPYVRKIPLEQFGFVTDGLTPSFLTRAAISQLVTAVPKLAKEMQDIVGPRLYDRILFGGNPIGDYVVTDSEDNPFGSFFNTLSATFTTTLRPPFMKDVFDYLSVATRNLFSEDEDLKEYTTVSAQTEIVWNHYATSMANWDRKVVAGTAEDTDRPKYKDAVEDAKNFILSTAVEKFMSSLGIVREPQSILVRKYFSDRIEYYKTPAGREELKPGQTPRMAGLRDTQDLYGKYATLFLAPKRENMIGGVPSQKAIEKGKALMPMLEKAVGNNSENIDLFPIFSMPLTLEEYDPAARAFLYSQTIEGIPILGRKFTPQEREDRAIEMLALSEVDSVWLEVQAALQSSKYKTLNANANRNIKEWYDERMDEIYKKYEDISFEEKFKDQGGTRFNRTFNAVKAVTEYKGKGWMDYLKANPDEQSLWATTTQWVEDREQFMEAMEAAKSTREKQYYSEIYRDRIYGFIRGNTYFADLYGMYFMSDPYFDRAYLVGRQLGEASQAPSSRTAPITPSSDASILDDVKLPPLPAVQSR